MRGPLLCLRPGFLRRPHLPPRAGRGVETCALGPGSPAAARSRCACAEMRRRRGRVEVSAQRGEVGNPARGRAPGPLAQGECGLCQHGLRTGRSPRKRAKVPKLPAIHPRGPVSSRSCCGHSCPSMCSPATSRRSRVIHQRPGLRCPLRRRPRRSRTLLAGLIFVSF